jgi:hypothetical protein
MKRSKNTRIPTRLSPGAIVASIVRLGGVTPTIFAECMRIRDKVTILNAIARLGYLTERHIEACTGITEAISVLLQELCDTDRLIRVTVEGFPAVYWIRPRGLSEVEDFEIPGIGTISPAQMRSSQRTTFCSCRIGDPMVMPHTLAVADIAVAYYRAYRGVVLGERMLRLAEKLTGRQIGTASITRSRRRCPDAVAIAPSGEVTAVEVECSQHTDTEVISAAKAYIRAAHIARVIYIAHGKMVEQVVNRCLKTVEEREKLVVVARNGKRLPTQQAIRPAGALFRHRRPDQVRARLAERVESDHGVRPHNSGRNRASRRSAAREHVRS